MSNLFAPAQLGPITAKNRIVRSATGESRADARGFVKDELLPIYEELAAGGVGLIISGHMYVHPDWKCSPRQTGIWSDEHVPGLRRLAQACKADGTRAVAQINYATRKPAELSLAEIEEAADCFVAAALRAESAGFDAVQIHASHGYLLSCCLTPSENERTDEYGGNAEGRRRLLIDIAKRTRAALAPETALLCKLGSVDGRDNSLPIEETIETAHALEAAGVQGLEISSTLTGDFAHPAAEKIDSVEKEAYFAPAARAIGQAVEIPVILVGGLRTLSLMEQLVADGTCDMVSLCRPFIREPDLVNAFRDGRADRAACISCNKCYNPRGFRCVFRPRSTGPNAKHTKPRSGLSLLLVGALAASAVHAQEWTQFRGPDGTGIGKGPEIPHTFAAEDFRWQTALQGKGSSSPVLWQQRLFVTSSKDKEGVRFLVCIDASSGETLWTREEAFKPYRHNRDNSFAASTPAVDSDGIYICWVSGNRFIMLAYDHAGRKKWERDLGPFSAQHGAGGSPIVFDGMVIAQNDNKGPESFAIGLDSQTGETRWKLPRKSLSASYITPGVCKPGDGSTHVVLASAAEGVTGISPADGKVLWEVPGILTQKSTASPVIWKDTIFVTGGRGGGGVESTAIRLSPNASKVYEIDRNLPYVPTPIVVEGRMYMLSDKGTVTCADMETGAVKWIEPVLTPCYSSPVCVNGVIYLISRRGEVVAIRAGTKFELIGRSQLPEGTYATPAIANGRMYIRTFSHIMCIGKGE